MSHIPPEVLDAAFSLVAAAAVYALHQLGQLLRAKTASERGDAAIESAEDILGDLVVQLAPELAKSLADGKIDKAEAESILAKAKALLGTKGLAALGKALKLDLSGVEAWLANKLGAKAALAAKEPVGLPPFFMSDTMAKKALAGELK